MFLNPLVIATIEIQAKDAGINIFQPKFINWSYLNLGKVPLIQININRNTAILLKNQINGIQPSFAPGISESGNGARHPPKNKVVARAETVTIFMYSAKKNKANFKEVYSV